jgi:hypothetical protein
MAYAEYVAKAILTGRSYDELPAKVKAAVPLPEFRTRCARARVCRVVRCLALPRLDTLHHAQATALPDARPTHTHTHTHTHTQGAGPVHRGRAPLARQPGARCDE